MGAFVLLRRDTLKERVLENRVLASFERQGFSSPVRRITPQWTIFRISQIFESAASRLRV